MALDNNKETSITIMLETGRRLKKFKYSYDITYDQAIRMLLDTHDKLKRDKKTDKRIIIT